MAISNVIIDGVPAGGEDDYAVLDVVGEPTAIDDPKDHLELGEALGLIDMERGAKVSGSRFYFLTGRVRYCSWDCCSWRFGWRPTTASSRSSRRCWCARR